MLSVAECRKHLKNSKYTDEQVEEIRNFLYKLAERIIEQKVNQ